MSASESSVGERSALLKRLFLGLDFFILNSVTHQLRDGVDFQFAHDVRAMRFRRLHTDAQRNSHFLAALAFGQKLNYFAFASSKAIARRKLRLDSRSVA